MAVSESDVMHTLEVYKCGVGYSFPLESCPDHVGEFIELYRIVLCDDRPQCVILDIESKRDVDIAIGATLSGFDPVTREYTLEVKMRRRGDSSPTDHTMITLGSSNPHHVERVSMQEEDWTFLISVKDIECSINDDVLHYSLTVAICQ